MKLAATLYARLALKFAELENAYSALTLKPAIVSLVYLTALLMRSEWFRLSLSNGCAKPASPRSPAVADSGATKSTIVSYWRPSVSVP